MCFLGRIQNNNSSSEASNLNPNNPGTKETPPNSNPDNLGQKIVCTKLEYINKHLASFTTIFIAFNALIGFILLRDYSAYQRIPLPISDIGLDIALSLFFMIILVSFILFIFIPSFFIAYNDSTYNDSKKDKSMILFEGFSYFIWLTLIFLIFGHLYRFPWIKNAIIISSIVCVFLWIFFINYFRKKFNDIKKRLINPSIVIGLAISILFIFTAGYYILK